MAVMYSELLASNYQDNELFMFMNMIMSWN